MSTARIASATGPVELYDEETGQGFPLIRCHEYGGGYRASEPRAVLLPPLPRRDLNQHVAEFLTSVESGRWGTWKRGG
jgi:hypothetical protein